MQLLRTCRSWFRRWRSRLDREVAILDQEYGQRPQKVWWW